MQLQKASFLVFLACLSDVFLLIHGKPDMELKAHFPNGIVTFTQIENDVQISLDEELASNGYNFTIHNFPVKFNGPMSEICKEKHVGGIFDPWSALDDKDYDTTCKSNSSKCAVGDLSGKFKNLITSKRVNDSNLSLSGKDGILGRSLVIRKTNGDLVSCATITPSSSSFKSVVGVFRAVSPGVAGTIVLRQSVTSSESDTSVDINLMLVDARSEPKTGLSLAVYTIKVSDNSDEGSCTGIDKMFNPLGITACDKRNHKTCPIGDLYAKLGPIQAVIPGQGSSRSFFIDSNLPLSGKNSVVGRSLVILENGQPLICAKIQEFQKFVGDVEIDGAERLLSFSQESLYEPVIVNASVGSFVGFNRNLDSKCSLKNDTSDWYNFTASGRADGLTLFGPNSVMFRQVLVKDGANKMCTTVKPKSPTYHLKAAANFSAVKNNPVTGIVQFEQAVFNTSKAFAYLSSFVVNLKYRNQNSKTSDHNWHVHEFSLSGLTIEKQLTSVKEHYNPYKVYVEANSYDTTCNADFPFRCELGDLSHKLGAFSFEDGPIHFTETENYLASWHNILGRSLVIHGKNKSLSRIAVADILPLDGSSYSQGSLICKNSTKTRDKTEFQNTVSKALGISSWRVANVIFEGAEGKPNCLKYSFSLIEDSQSNLQKTFTDIKQDNSGKLNDFAPACGESSSKWKINDGNVDEILSVVFGVIALIVLIIVIVFWLKKKNENEEQKSKLVVKDDNVATNPDPENRETTKIPNNPTEVGIDIEPIEESEPNDRRPRKDSKEYKVTTSL